MAAPYNRQGEPLDAALGVTGHWVEYGGVFLLEPPTQQSSVAVKLPSGETSIGVNPADIASAFHMPLTDLLQENRDKNLSYRVEERAPERRAIKFSREYTFVLPHRGESSCTVNVTRVLGA